MKTVIHWRETGKAFGLVILVSTALAIALLPWQLSQVVQFLVGIVAGGATMIYAIHKWQLFHFEQEEQSVEKSSIDGK